MLSLLTGRLGLYAAAALAVLSVVGAIYWAGGREARQEAEELRDHIETKERMDEADPDFTDCPWHDRLRGVCK